MDTENWVPILKGQTHDFVKGEPYRQDTGKKNPGDILYNVYSSWQNWTFDPEDKVHSDSTTIYYDENWKPPSPPIAVDADVFYQVLDMLEREEEDDRRSISSLCFSMALARKALQEAVIHGK